MTKSDIQQKYDGMLLELDTTKGPLSKMFSRCKHFAGMFTDWGKCKTDIVYRRSQISYFLTSIFIETAEAFEKTDWKQHHTKSDNDDIDGLKIELIDLQHFIINTAIAIDMSPSEFVQAFTDKNERNWRRQLEGRNTSTDYELT